MGKYKIFAVSIFVLVTSLVLLICTQMICARKQAVNAVFVGGGAYKAGFEEVASHAKIFFDLYDKSIVALNAGDQAEAIELLRQSLSHADYGLARGMAYKQLAEIYRAQSDLEKELFCVEQLPKYSMNPRLNEEAKLRAEEIRHLLQNKAQSENEKVTGSNENEKVTNEKVTDTSKGDRQ